jgi:hypothetical protein
LFEPRCIAGYGGGFPVTDHIIGGTKHILLPSYYRKTSFLVEKFKKKCEKFPCAAASVGVGVGVGVGEAAVRGETIKEKVHSTTLIYRRNLGFNLQSQNQVLDIHELYKPDV